MYYSCFPISVSSAVDPTRLLFFSSEFIKGLLKSIFIVDFLQERESEFILLMLSHFFTIPWKVDRSHTMLRDLLLL